MRQPLGRGLDAILGGPQPSATDPRPLVPRSEPVRPEGEQKGKPLMVPVERVMAGRSQPRRRFEEEPLEELAASIRENGILQPLVVVSNGTNYELIAGERRLRAAIRAGLDKVPVVLREATPEGEMLELALVENLQREDLGTLERARAYERLLESHGLTQEDVARKVGKSRVAVANTLRLLALPQPVLDSVDQGLLTEGHARALLALPTAARQIEAMQSVVRKTLSVRDTEQLVRDWTEAAGGAGTKAVTRAAKSAPGPLDTKLSRALGTKVRVRGGGRKGRIEIEFYSQEELTRLIDLLTSRESL
jgi:ParB family transcriptional regulator, chromosome partitioning protein